ncbi:MAG TPA: Flp family type IVb pilin [Desulfuromonadales bacterium]|nr:Flp family type IVb pilin [Desulfuromonadales bacterium]
MKKLGRKLWELAIDEEGATAVEYGLMVAAIAALIVGAVFTLGGYVNGAFTTVNTSLNGNVTPNNAPTAMP